jgi:sec-independent protein translocase protein TatB
MQMFGIGILELMVILVLSVLVIGPDRMPAFAADLARWIRQARVYANHLLKDFNEVVGDLEKEAGVTREDWKEIGSVISRHTGDVVKEVQRAADAIETSAGPDTAQNGAAAPAAAAESNGNQPAVPPPIEAADEAEPQTDTPAEDAEEKPWYVPEPPRRSRRRSAN